MRLAFLFVALFLGACSRKAPAAAPQWHVTNGFIRDDQGRAVGLRGMQISGAQKSPPYIATQTFADYQRMRDEWGFNSLRFLMVWAAIEPMKGQYDTAYLDEVATRVGWAQQLGLSVILDMHQDIYGEGFGFDGAPAWACASSYYAAFKPNSDWSLNAIDPSVESCTDQLYTSPDTLAHFTEAWRQVALRLGGNSAVVGFDILNEPEWGTYDLLQFEHDRLQPFYEHIIPVVRSAAPQWLAFAEPASSRNLGFATGLGPFPFPDVVYAPHSYDTTAETSASFPPGDAPGLIANLAALQGEAKHLNAALWVGEYGGQWNDPNIDAYMTAQYGGIGAVAGGSDYWDYDFGGGYSPVAADGTEHPTLIGALIRPYPSRTAGDPVSFAYVEESSTFTYEYRPDSRIAGPTEIVVPARLYPKGFQVECGGCAYQTTTSGINVTEPPGASPATIVIHP